MLVDYHVHPNTFIDSRYKPIIEPLKQYIQVGKEKGISEIGFAEHGPRFHPTYKHTALTLDDIPLYIQTLKELCNYDSSIQIKIGIEADYSSSTENQWKEIINKYPFDFVACSIHYLNDWLPTKEGMLDYIHKGKTIDQLYTDYYRTLQKAAQSQLFSFMAHPDLIKIHSLVNKIPSPKNLQSLYEETCAVLKEYNQVIEFDTGWKKGSFDCYRPEPEFLEIAYRYNLPITLGSDAHQATDIGSYFNEAKEILHRIGYTQIISFTRMKSSFISLD